MATTSCCPHLSESSCAWRTTAPKKQLSRNPTRENASVSQNPVISHAVYRKKTIDIQALYATASLVTCGLVLAWLFPGSVRNDAYVLPENCAIIHNRSYGPPFKTFLDQKRVLAFGPTRTTHRPPSLGLQRRHRLPHRHSGLLSGVTRQAAATVRQTSN